MSTQRRLDRLTRRMATRPGAAERPAGGQCHDDPEHVTQVLQILATCGALPDVLARSGLTLDNLGIEDVSELSPVGVLPPGPGRRRDD